MPGGNRMRILYMGTPSLAVIPLEALLECPNGYDVVGVVTAPAKPTGRRKVLTDPPMAQWARDQGLMVLQPAKVSTPECIAQLKELAPDVIVTCAFGQILSTDFLRIPKRGTINIHPSMLPLYRGATPVQSALLDGREQTGVTILFTVRALDAGNIICQRPHLINPADTNESLSADLFKVGGELLVEALGMLRDPNFVGTPQDESAVSTCSKIDREDGRVDWNRPSVLTINRCRAYYPWPGSYCFLGETRIILERMSSGPFGAEEVSIPLGPCGTFWVDSAKRLLVKTVDGFVSVDRIRVSGKKSMTGSEFWNGFNGRCQNRFT